MSIYRTYALEVYDHNEGAWTRLADHEASNRPHHYDTLRQGFERLVRLAKEAAPPYLLGYRITVNGHPVDTWTNEKGD